MRILKGKKKLLWTLPICIINRLVFQLKLPFLHYLWGTFLFFLTQTQSHFHVFAAVPFYLAVVLFHLLFFPFLSSQTNKQKENCYQLCHRHVTDWYNGLLSFRNYSHAFNLIIVTLFLTHGIFGIYPYAKINLFRLS